MLYLDVVNLADVDDIAAVNEGDWLSEGRLPYGCTVVTGLAGRTCSAKELEGALISVMAEYVTCGEVCGGLSDAGEVLWVNLGKSSRVRKTLKEACGESAGSINFCSVDAKVGAELAVAIEETLDDMRDVCLAVVSSTAAGIEGRGKMSQYVAELSRIGHAKKAAIILVVPLKKSNAMCVEDPSTGIAKAADAVWKLYPAGNMMKCFCTFGTGGEAFDVAPIAKPKRNERKAPAQLQADDADSDLSRDMEGYGAEESVSDEEGDGSFD